MSGVLLRQAVLVASDRDAVAGQLRAQLALGEPFDDEGVGTFGLHNAVFALGDRFIEVIAPVREGTAAGRYLDRHGGDGGYMLIFQFDDLPAARRRAAELGIRTVWQADLEDIAGTHLHPADMGGAIVSLDWADPPESWRWGGPDWIGGAGTGAPGRLGGVSVSVPEPEPVAARWAGVLGAEPDGSAVGLGDGGTVRFVPGDRGLTEVSVAVPEPVRRGRDAVEIGGVRFLLSTYEEDV